MWHGQLQDAASREILWQLLERENCRQLTQLNVPFPWYTVELSKWSDDVGHNWRKLLAMEKSVEELMKDPSYWKNVAMESLVKNQV